jgi:hypothetical protein
MVSIRRERWLRLCNPNLQRDSEGPQLALHQARRGEGAGQYNTSRLRCRLISGTC